MSDPREVPVIMNAESVLGSLAGSKTQTRRLARLTDDQVAIVSKYFGWKCHAGGVSLELDGGVMSVPLRTPYVVGDRLWVKETWQAWRGGWGEYDDGYEPITAESRDGATWAEHVALNGKPAIEYRATSTSSGPWTPSLFMPRWASRLTLEITNVRLQRLQQIDEGDCLAEGYTGTDPEPVAEGGTIYAWHGRSSAPCPRAHYAVAWDRINGKRATWESNPWVWAITFRKGA